MTEVWRPQIPEVPALTGVAVTVNGDVAEASWGHAPRPKAWRGFAVAREPVLALAFATGGANVRWVKSSPSWGNAVSIEIGQGSWKGRHRVGVQLGSLVWPRVRAARSWEEFSRRECGFRPADGEIQVPDSCGGALLDVWGEGIDEPGVWPRQRIQGETGRLLPLLHLNGRAPLRIDLLVLPRRLLRTGRCKIWQLRPRHRAIVPEPLRHVLCFGRAGLWPPRCWPNQRYGRLFEEAGGTSIG